MTKLITSALPYANGPIHAGHLVEYIQTDIYVRFLRLLDEDVAYCCADDTHGAPIELKAQELRISPEALIATMHKDHQEDFTTFHISFDSYYSTHSPENKQFAELIFTRNKEAGNIYTKDIEVTYCDHCNRYLPDRFIKGACPKCGAPDQYGDQCEKCNAAYKSTELINSACVTCGTKPVLKQSNHYFFKLAPFSDKILQWLDTIQAQPEVANYVKSWIKEGLQDWDISRDAPYFGFTIPGETDKYFYVWLDAPIGYISSFEHYTQQHEKEDALTFFSNKDSHITHFIGKDITYFHFLFWPAMLLGAGLTTPKKMVVHGFLTVNGEKMSKSRGTFHTAKALAETYNPELLRYYYAKNLSLKLADIDFSLNEFSATINNELIGNILNFCHRVLTFVWDNYDGKTAERQEISELTTKQTLETIKTNYEHLDFSKAVKHIVHLAQQGNRAFQDLAPWQRIKTDKRRIHSDLTTFIELVRDISIVLSPILPITSKNIQTTLNLPELIWKDLGKPLRNHQINKPTLPMERITIQETTFSLDLRAATIKQVNDHPDAEKLYVLQVDLGEEQRQLVAGLKNHYVKGDLIGKKIVIVANLKPAKLRGVKSQGMLLAADDGNHVKIVEANAHPGTSITPAGEHPNTAQIKIDAVEQANLTVINNTATSNGKPLVFKNGTTTVAMQDGTRIR